MANLYDTVLPEQNLYVGSRQVVAGSTGALYQMGTAITSTAAELNTVDVTTAGTVQASKAVVVDANKDAGDFRNLDCVNLDAGSSGAAGTVDVFPATASKGKLAITCADQTGNTTVTLSADAMGQATAVHIPDPGAAASYLAQSTAALSLAEVDVLDAVTAGTIAASKAVVVGSGKTVNEWLVTATSASTNGSTSVEPMVMSSTMTGAGGVGGRARFQLDTNVALGGWANALKGYTKFGAAGAVTGLASAIVAEMDLSAGTAAGTYAPLELELNLGAGALTGTETSLIYASVNGAAAGTFDDNGVVLSLKGVTAGDGHVFQASAVAGVASTHALKIKIGDTLYYIPLHTSASFA